MMECTCTIKAENNPLEPIGGNIILSIVYCPLHKSAPDMYEALNNLLDGSICDICYEDECGGMESCMKGKDNEPCKCHFIIQDNETKAVNALAKAVKK